MESGRMTELRPTVSEQPGEGLMRDVNLVFNTFEHTYRKVLARGFLPGIEEQSPELPARSWSISTLIAVEEMTETIRLALEDSCVRGRLRRAGLARAAEFSWERYAREEIRIYTRIFSSHG